MQTIEFSGIAEQLSKAKSENAGLIKSLLETKALTEPPEEHLKAHFLSKHYFYSDNILDEGELSAHDMEEMFFELTDRALFASYRGDTELAEQHFESAGIIADELNDGFLNDQLSSLQAIVKNKASLKKKLICDSCYEQVNKMLARNVDEAHRLIALTRAFAIAIKDRKRELDVLIKTLYLVYASDDEALFPAGILLSRYIQQQEPEYETSTIWALFHEGNINISLGNNQRTAAQPNNEKARQFFLEAKNCFEKALELAIKKQFDYATMTMYERLGLTHNRLELFNLARANFNESLNIGKFGVIRKDWLILKNKVRCLIGLGNVHLDCGRLNGEDKEMQLSDAESYFKDALELAQQINYIGNVSIALRSLVEVCETRGDKDATHCLSKYADSLSENA